MGDLLVELLVARIEAVLIPLSYTFEIVLVNDGSPDNSYFAINEIAKKNERVKAIHLNKNFGQHIAIKAGLDFCSGEWIVVMDCDLQDRPEEIPAMLQLALNQNDAVFAERIKRNDSFLKRFYSAAFYSVLGVITFYKMNGKTANFGIYHHKIITNLIQRKYRHFFFPLAVRNVADKVALMPVMHDVRAAGVTAYSFKKAFYLALQVLLNNGFIAIFIQPKTVVYEIKETVNFEL
jgi:polyisoprenyl-phosphate glycosyltransferase